MSDPAAGCPVSNFLRENRIFAARDASPLQANSDLLENALMKRQIMHVFEFGVAFLGLSTFAVAQSMGASGTRANDPTAGTNQPMRLMAGDANLLHGLDTRSAIQGEKVTARLTETIETPQGIQLPAGTDLVGRVDQVKASNEDGPARLVLTFNQAQLKDGTTYPVKATLLEVAPPDSSGLLAQAVGPDGAFDQEPGVDGGMSMHSAVKQMVSGTLTDPHHNFKLAQGSQLLVAVGVQQNAQAAAGAS
jgi:hypothetical protein